MNLSLYARFALSLALVCVCHCARGDDAAARWEKIAPFFSVPKEYAGQYGDYRSPLIFDDKTPVKTPQDWQRRRAEILADWQREVGTWPPVIDKPKIEYIETKQRDNFTQHKVKVEIAAGLTDDGYLLVPEGKGPFPAVVIPFYDPESSAGLNKRQLCDFGYQLSRRGFVTLSIGSPGGDARKPNSPSPKLQPLSYLGYVGANCYNALAALPNVDPNRIGIVGHSYGGKWSMFASCFYEKFAAAVWSDPGIVWDEKRSNINYWEPWYLGLDPVYLHRPGLVTETNPRTGAYKSLFESGHDLQEVHALMAPRPFMVSGGAEDTVARWVVLNHAIAVNKLLGYENRVAMTNRPNHQPTVESNEAIYLFFEHFLIDAK